MEKKRIKKSDRNVNNDSKDRKYFKYDFKLTPNPIAKEHYVNRLIRLYLLLFFVVALTTFILSFSTGFFIRLLSPKEIDDVSPNINCSDSLLNKVDVLNIIPLFDNKSIADDPAWCKKILSLNKTLAMHGVYHTYEEFGTDRTDQYLQTGLDAFVKCFGKKPVAFKPPQLEITKDNKELIKKYMPLHWFENEKIRKVYHCSDTGLEKNAAVDIYAIKDYNNTI